MPISFQAVVEMRMFYTIFGLLLCAELSLQYCYQLKLLGHRTTDSPEYRLSMWLHDNQTVSSLTVVSKAIPVPIWRFLLVQRKDGHKAARPKPPTVLYNSSVKVCEFWRYTRRIRFFNNLTPLLFNKEYGNMSLTCPLPKGTYEMRNMHMPPDTPILKFMYWPNSLYTVSGNVYSVLPNQTLATMAYYEINATVLKTC